MNGSESMSGVNVSAGVVLHNSVVLPIDSFGPEWDLTYFTKRMWKVLVP